MNKYTKNVRHNERYCNLSGPIKQDIVISIIYEENNPTKTMVQNVHKQLQPE
jgi:hypothetical protein